MQQADPTLVKYFKIKEDDLTRRRMQIFHQGNLFKVMDAEKLLMVPHAASKDPS